MSVDPEPLDPDRNPALVDVALAIAEQSDVNWEAMLLSDSGSIDPGLNELKLKLRVIDRLLRGHDQLRASAEAAPSSAVPDLLPAPNAAEVRWGPLIVRERVGSGSFGTVYRAFDPKLDREVALKILADDGAAPDEIVKEASALARLHHPNVVGVFGAERIDGRTGIWMEYVRGQSLAAGVQERGPFSAGEAARIGVDVCRVLAAVHAAGLLHRDVKAQNVLRTPEGRVVLGDFGTTIRVDDARAGHERRIAGTPLYLAPEVLAGQPATAASDLYSVGVLLYFLITGDHPVRGRTVAEIKRAHATNQQAEMRRHSEAVLPAALAPTIDALLDPDPTRRPSCTDVETALQPRSKARRRRFLAVAAAAAVLAAVSVGLVSWRAGPVLPFEERDWVLVTPFENRSGDDAFSGVIESALERELVNSTFVNVVPRARVEDTLMLMAQPVDTRLDERVGRELCLRDGAIKAMVIGRVEKVAAAYTITSRIVNPADGVVVLSLIDDAPSESEVLAVVRRQALDLRRALGEAMSSSRASRQALARVTTPSLRALRLYSEAAALMQSDSGPMQNAPAEKLLRSALAGDPDFGSARILLAHALRNQGRAREEFLPIAERAFQSVDRVSPAERHFIEGTYHEMKGGPGLSNLGELEQSAASYEALVKLHPGHPWALNNLFILLRRLGRWPEADDVGIRAADERPRNFRFNVDAARILLRRGDYPAARRYHARALEVATPQWLRRDPSLATGVRLFEAVAGWAELDPRAALNAAEIAASGLETVPAQERQIFLRQLSRMYLTLGRLQQAGQVARTISDAEARNYEIALMLRERGDLAGLRAHLRTDYRESSDGRRVAFLARAGDINEAERELQHLRGEANVAASFRELVEGELRLAQGRSADAIVLLQRATSSGPRAPNETRLTGLTELSRAWAARGELTRAIDALASGLGSRAEGATGIQNSWPTGFAWISGRAELARLHRTAGQIPQARGIEAELLKLLAVADADHPILIELRGRQ